MDYSAGRFKVFDQSGVLIGRIDEDEFVRRGSELLYRIDGNEVYGLTNAGQFLAFIENGRAITPQGKVLFGLEEE